MKQIKEYIQKHWFALGIVVIVIIAALLRFYDYPNRWGLGYDQAHDAILARYALSHFQIPLLGPFSSAGPFQTAGEWYWLVMLGSALFPFWVNGPWVLITLLQLVFVGSMIFVGKELLKKQFGLLLGLIAAISPAEISQATNLTVTAPMSLVSALAILLMIIFVKKRSNLSIFLFGFFVGLAMSIHTQGASLLALVGLTLLIARPSLKQLFLLGIGMLIPLTPIFLVESRYGFFNTKGILQYYLHDQYRVPLEVLGRRWLTYAGVLWPTAIASAIGGLKPFGYFVAALWIVVIPFFFRRKKIEKYWIILAITFVVFVIALRYVHTPLFDSYFMFVHPFMFIFTGLAIFQLLRSRRSQVVGGIVLFAIIAGSLFQVHQIIKKSDNWTNYLAASWYKLLVKDYPNKQFNIYDYEYKTSSVSFPLVLYLQYYNKIDPLGYAIAVGAPSIKIDAAKATLFPSIKGNVISYTVLDANSSTSAQLSEMHWSQINPYNVYRSTEEWYTYKK